MENAADALKIVLAVFIFAIGLTILFNMASQAKETARVLISETDKTKDYLYLDKRDDGYYITASNGEDIRKITDNVIDANGNRIVSLSDIIPALYRYSEENYAVTIIDKNGNIVARFDLDTEQICNRWENETITDIDKYTFINEVNKVLNEVNILSSKISDKQAINLLTHEWKLTYDMEHNVTSCSINKSTNDDMINLFKRLYGQHPEYGSDGNYATGTIGRAYYCHWLGTMGWIAQRIDSDLSRNRCLF